MKDKELKLEELGDVYRSRCAAYEASRSLRAAFMPAFRRSISWSRGRLMRFVGPGMSLGSN